VVVSDQARKWLLANAAEWIHIEHVEAKPGHRGLFSRRRRTH
jgi:hypothetical protein